MEYKPTSLEKVHKTELHTDHDLGVVIDLINPETYKVSSVLAKFHGLSEIYSLIQNRFHDRAEHL